MPKVEKKPASSSSIHSARATRSQMRVNNTTSPEQTAEEAELLSETNASSFTIIPPPTVTNIDKLPAKLTAAISGLTRRDHATLLKKQRWLWTYMVDIPKGAPTVAPALDATLVFAQEEAGTAVCISSQGLLLTCSHCVAETAEELDYDKIHWLLFSSGTVVAAKCVKWDNRRDLALLQISASQISQGATSAHVSPPTSFPRISLSTSSPPLNAPLCCIGHPGTEDLETSEPGIKPNYDVVHVSEGLFQGYAEGQDLQDNSEIGALMHDCWTYWGHSGAPIVSKESSELVGLHSSWDEETGMRRGVPLEAIVAFLE